MHLSRLLLRSLRLGVSLLSITTSLALAAHVAPVTPLTSLSNHSHEKFPSQVFPAAVLTSIDLSFADLSNCTFAPGTDLSFADFTGANLTNTNFSGCNLDNANFRGANLSFAVLPCAGGADFRGAILTGTTAPGGVCTQCGTVGPNAKDACTVGDLPSLCMQTAAFRGVVAGVVFTDLNSNGQLDFGEPGVPGASAIVTAGGPPIGILTDSRGAYEFVSTVAGPASVSVVLPVGLVFGGPGLQNLNLATCRSGQTVNFPVLNPVTPALKTTFGRVKALYR